MMFSGSTATAEICSRSLQISLMKKWLASNMPEEEIGIGKEQEDTIRELTPPFRIKSCLIEVSNGHRSNTLSTSKDHLTISISDYPDYIYI